MKVEIDQQDLRKVKSMLVHIRDNVKPVQARAINRTLTGIKADVSTAIRADLNLKKQYVDKHITTSKASSRSLLAGVITKSTPIGLINFTGVKQNKKGVSVKVKKSAKRSTLKHAFIQRAKNATNVFRRAVENGKRVARFPIERLTGPRLTDNLSKDEIIKPIEAKAGERLIKNIDHEISRELQKAG